MQGHFISTVVGLFFSFSVLAQPLQGVVENNYTYRHFTLSDGLPQIQCLTLSSDSRGFVWVGTKFGAARWDGRQFTIFNCKNGTRGDLMNCFSESDDGSLLAGFLNVSFSIISGNFVQSYSLPVSGGEYSIQQSFSLGRKQSLILAVPRFIDSSGFESRLFVFDRNTRSFTRQFRLQAKSIDLLNTEGSILGFSQYKQDETGPLLVSYYKWDKLISNRRFFCRIFPHGGSNNRNTLLEFPSLPGRWYTLSVRDNQVDTTLAYEIKSPDFNSKSVRMAFITGNHKTAYYYDNSSRIMKSSGNSIESIGQIPFVNDIYEDNAGNLWVSSEQGLYSFFRQTFKEIKFNVNPGQYDDIWSVSHDRKGSYFYSSWHNRSWQSVDGNKTWKKMDWVYQDKLLSKIVTGSFGGCSTQLGGTLLPTGYDFYYLHPPSRARLFHLPTQLQIFGTLEDSVKHEIYIHQFAALYRLNELSLKLDPLILPADKITNSIIQLCFDKDNRLVVFGRGGPLRLEDGKWKKLKHLPMDVLSATRDFAGNLWVSDWLNLCIYKYDTLIRLKYLPSREMTIALTTYKNRWLVIGGSADLTFMDLDAFYKTGKEIYYRFDAGSGLNILEGGQNNFYHDLDGTILWPCSDKLIRIFPERLLHAEVPNVPQVMLGKAYNQNGHFILLADTSGKTGFFLPHGYRNLEFTFAAAVFNNNEVLKYRYRLSGYNELWSEPNNLTEANFDNVPPGKYRFEVQSSINGEDWSESSFSDTVVVPSYFYETSLYKILMFIVAILAVAVLTILLTQ